MRPEQVIINGLLKNEEYARKVIPFIKESYFDNESDKFLFISIDTHFEKYNSLPTITELLSEVGGSDTLTQTDADTCDATLSEIRSNDDVVNHKWLVDNTEEFCQDQAISNAIMDSFSIINGDDKTRSKHILPELLQDALSVTFNTSVGHDFFKDAAKRHDYYSLDVHRSPFDIEILNTITNGGCPKKTLNIILAGINVGKSLFLVHLAVSYMLQGKNVLYVTAEMAEEEISSRMDANTMDTDINTLGDMTKKKFLTNLVNIKKKTAGRMIVKEYPTSSAHVGHIRQTLQELKLKRNFTPDVIVVDYLGIMASSRISLGQAGGSYGYIKSIAEELRGLAVETETILWSAAQVNRDGFNNTDVEMTNVGESFGLPATADFMLAVVRTDELDEMNQLFVKQLKNRYGNKSVNSKFTIGVEIEKMKLFDVELSADTNIHHSNEGFGTHNEKVKPDTSGLMT